MIYIHIGFGKTGTTWLQRIVFPEWMKDNNVAFYNHLLFHELYQLPSEKILISNETIAMGPGFGPGYLRGLRNILFLFKDAKIIITKREMESLTDSYNKQMILSKKKTKCQVPDMINYQESVLGFLGDKNVNFLELDITNFHSFVAYRSLAEFMDIKAPTVTQILKWKKIRKQVSRPTWALNILKMLNRLKGNKLRWLLIYFTDPDRKEKKWYYL